MIWGGFLLLAVLTLLPALFRVGATGSGRRDAALALHRAQLLELERDRRQGLIAPDEHGQARLEVQRRLLASADADEPASQARPVRRGTLLLGLALVPVLALALYLPQGHPELAAQPVAKRMREADARLQQDAALVEALRQGLAKIGPDAPQARAGYLLLGQAEASRGNWGAAAAAWRVALQHGFDPSLAAQAAEAQCRADGAVSAGSAALFRRALDAGPKDAPWRALAEQRLAQAEHH
jgi:cytochrome c-type biogenesis protein CcmH